MIPMIQDVPGQTLSMAADLAFRQKEIASVV
jgi:hypothetical protein